MFDSGVKAAFIRPEDIEQRCSICSRVLPSTGAVRRVNGKILCERCYKSKNSNSDAGSAAPQMEIYKKRLYATIKRVFSISEIPDFIFGQIEGLLKEDSNKSYGSIDYTIRYAVDVCGFEPDIIYGIKGMVSLYYEQAKRQFVKEQEAVAYNSSVQISNSTRTYKIPKNEESSRRFIPKTNLEELEGGS